jgi:SAM-dependent methyltransferase
MTDGPDLDGAAADNPGNAPADSPSPEEFWESFYGRDSRVWSGEPNPDLVRETADLPVGTALDLGCGEGADVVWLAEHGWTVTGVDISRTALDRAARHAQHAGVGDRVRWEQHDLGASFPEGRYDLVSAQFLHAPVELPREQILRRAVEAVAPGGVLLIVGHTGHLLWDDPDRSGPCFPTSEEVLRALDLPQDRWQVLTDRTRQHSSTGPDGQPRSRVDNTLTLCRLDR